MTTMSDEPILPVTVPSLRKKKELGEKIVALTAYDYPTARLLDEAGADILLVGDSLGMVVLGYPSTIPVTMDEMVHHTKAVVRGTRRALVVGDMPYFSFHQGGALTIANASRFLKEAGAAAVKLEGASAKRLKLVEDLVEAEIPVMGHVGLTPQSVHHLGRFRVKGTRGPNLAPNPGFEQGQPLPDGWTASGASPPHGVLLDLAAPQREAFGARCARMQVPAAAPKA